MFKGNHSAYGSDSFLWHTGSPLVENTEENKIDAYESSLNIGMDTEYLLCSRETIVHKGLFNRKERQTYDVKIVQRLMGF